MDGRRSLQDQGVGLWIFLTKGNHTWFILNPAQAPIGCLAFLKQSGDLLPT